jgi:hypothetical protein
MSHSIPTRRTLALAVTAFSLFALAGLAEAATVVTPALGKDAAENFNCRVVNTGNRTLSDISIAILSLVGGELSQFTFPSIASGHTVSVGYSQTQTIGYCRVEGKFPQRALLITFCRAVGGVSVTCVTPQ